MEVYFFADLSANTAIFDFAETTFCTILFEFQQLCQTMMVAGSS